MNFGDWLLWGFAATLVLTTLLAAAQSLHLTRMNLVFLLGTMFTPDRDRAKLIGFGFHLANGWLFALVYLASFHSLGFSGPLWGALVGAVHGAFVLWVGLPLLPSLHPRMATEQAGPLPVRRLEPPGVLGLHYGKRTPWTVMAVHIVFGMILGGFYHV